jgi:hypothetical protein
MSATTKAETMLAIAEFTSRLGRALDVCAQFQQRLDRAIDLGKTVRLPPCTVCPGAAGIRTGSGVFRYLGGRQGAPATRLTEGGLGGGVRGVGRGRNVPRRGVHTGRMVPRNAQGKAREGCESAAPSALLYYSS